MKTIIAIFAASWFGAAHAAPPDLDAAVARAAAEHKPLIVEFCTTWCGPCLVFEEEVLPDPRVQRALADVVFVRYDVEQEPGAHVYARYGARGMPAFVAIDANHVERLRREGLPTAESFIKLVAEARVAVALGGVHPRR
jgi:thioredoxin:protein disulfide reductase